MKIKSFNMNGKNFKPDGIELIVECGGDDPITVGEALYMCECCKQFHGGYSDCMQGQRA